MAKKMHFFYMAEVTGGMRKKITVSKANQNKIIKKNGSKLSVVILCYKSGAQVFDFVKKVNKNFKNNDINDYELILVGNYTPGKNDRTPEVVREIAKSDEKIKFVSKPKQGMMGWDMKSGLKIADGDFIAVIDGDGQMPIADLVRVYKSIKTGELDIVKTYRLTRGDGLWRKIISYVYNCIFLLLFPGLKARDINSKPKILTREFLKKLNLDSDDWFIDAEIMIQARRLKARIGELPTQFHGLTGKRRSFVKLPAIFEFITNLIVYRIKELRK